MAQFGAVAPKEKNKCSGFHTFPCRGVTETSNIHHKSLSGNPILHTIDRTPWASDQPVTRPLPTQNKHTQRYQCLE
jgi:hypothetical protein